MADATYGGFWIRTLAYAVDLAILMAGLLLLAVVLTFTGGAGTVIYSVIATLGPIAYFVWLTASGRQATFGKQLCGLKVQHAGSGERISLLRSIARELGKLVSAAVLMIGFLLIAFTGRKQGLHDMLASTEVVREGTARVGLALFVAIAGVVVPVVVIPLMFGALFAGLMMAMMGGMTGETEVKQPKPVPQMEQKAAPRPQAPATQPAPQPSAAASAVSAPKPAAGDPETVYRNFHSAALAADLDGLRQWGTKQKGDELAAASVVERKVTLGLMAKLMPKTFKVTSSEVSADGKKAILRLVTGQPEKDKTDLGRGSAVLLKEGDAWKVDESIWGSGQPPALSSQSASAKPAAAEPSKPAAMAAPKPAAVEPPKPTAVELPKPVAASAPAVKQAAPASQPRTAPSRREAASAKPAAEVLQQRKPPCVYKPVMTDQEIANCR